MDRKSTTFPAHVSSDTIARESGKTLKQWFSLLEAHVNELSLPEECASFINKEYGVSADLATFISLKYCAFLKGDSIEQETDKCFYTSATKTFPIGIHVLESYLTDESLRLSWLEPHFKPELINTGRNMRLSSRFNGLIQISFKGKGPQKCQITIQHLNLASEEAAIELQAFWKEKLNSLKKVLNVND
jgi:hypothetical protein